MGERVIKSIHNVFKQYRKVNLVNPYLFSKPFESTWRTSNTSTGSSASAQIKLPLVSGGSYNFRVDWGDGTSDNITVWNQAQTTHTYSISGNYTIKITGSIVGFQFNNTGDRLKILSVKSWGVLKMANGLNMEFFGCANLNLSAVEDILDISSKTSLNSMFRDCTSLTSVNRFNEWNFLAVNSMPNTFWGDVNFNQELNYNAPNVTIYSGFLQGCSKFNSNLSFSTSKTNDFERMLGNCFIFNKELSGLDMSEALKINFMLTNATAFDRNIGMWNISKVTSAASFMAGKTASNFSAANLDAIYIGWSSRPVKPNVTITFGTAKRTSASSAAKAILTGSPNNWSITDGGI